MRILVTGGAGFIGSNIVDRFIAEGHEVAVIDNLSTGRAENLNPEARFYEMSIRDEAVAAVFAEFQPEIVDHHAAQMDVRRSVAEPMFDAGENVLGSLNIIVNALAVGTKKIIYASTGGAVYGEVECVPVTESHPINPISQYGISKHTVEHYLFLYKVNYGLDYTVLRYPNVYGPRQDPHGEAGVIAIFSEALYNSREPTIFGDGSQTRDYTFVGDIVEANVIAMEKGSGGIFNIGTGLETSVNEVFAELEKNFKTGLRPINAPERVGEIQRIALDASKAAAELGWRPGLTFAEGVARTVAYYRGLKGA